MNRHIKCFSQCWWDSALLTEKWWNLLNEVATFLRQRCHVEIVWHVLSEFEIPEVWLSRRRLTECKPHDDLRMHRKPSVSWKCGRFEISAVDCVKHPGMCQFSVRISADFDHRCFPVISGNLSQTSDTNLLFFLPTFSFPSSVFGEICLCGYHMFILWLLASKQTCLLKSACCYFCFFIFTVFCIWNYFS